jgi:hypothetical protein
MEKYLQAAYELYRQDVKENYLSYDQFRATICKPTTPFWVWLAGGAVVGYSLKK